MNPLPNANNPAWTATLLTRLRDDVARHDGDATVETIAMLRIVAGSEFTDALLDDLITLALTRLAGGQR
jgi:hypothetical protein